MNKYRICLSAVILLAGIVGAGAQDTQEKPSTITYAFNLMPDTNGTLNARIDLGARWTPWIESGIAAFTDNYSQPFDTDTDVSTIISNGKALELTILRVDEDLLWLLLKKPLDFLEFSAGIIGAYNLTEQQQYGYDPSNAAPLFYLDESIKSVLRPLQSYSLGVRLGPVALSGIFESTLYWSTETITSSHFTSDMAVAPEPGTITYSGGDTRVGGEAEVDLRVARIIGGLEYYSHVMTDGTMANTSKSETWTFRGAVLLSFLQLAGGSPLIGASIVNKSDYFVVRDENIDTSNIRLEIGLRY